MLTPTDMLALLNLPKSLAGRVALVTGVEGGIGRAIAEELGAAGAAVAVVARPEAHDGATVNAIRTAGGNVYAACVAALQTHTLNLAAELAGTGVTVNALRIRGSAHPRGPGTKPLIAIRSQTPLFRRFVSSQIDVDVIDSVGPAKTLLTQVLGTDSGHIWDTVHPDPVQ